MTTEMDKTISFAARQLGCYRQNNLLTLLYNSSPKNSKRARKESVKTKQSTNSGTS